MAAGEQEQGGREQEWEWEEVVVVVEAIDDDGVRLETLVECCLDGKCRERGEWVARGSALDFRDTGVGNDQRLLVAQGLHEHLVGGDL